MKMQFVWMALLLLASPHLVTDGVAQDDSRRASHVQRVRRVLYNFDGDSCLSTKAGSKGPVAVSVSDVRRLIEEVAYDESQVDTVLVCVNAQVMYYPTKVGTLRGTVSSPEERTRWPASEVQRFENLRTFFAAGVDPYAIMLDETKRKGREALLTFRMNDDHGNDFLRTQFWTDHPDCRLGRGALDFGREEVRDYTAQLIEEAVRRYDCDGMELDFNRFPTFFKDDELQDERVKKMNSLVERVRKMLDEVGHFRGRRLVLGVRVPSNYGRTPPTPESSRALGCDIAAWAENGWLDFVTISEFLFTRDDLPIKPWKEIIRDVPVYGGIECTEGGNKEQYLTPEKYRRAARHLQQDGADGIYLFNFFTTREYGSEAWEPPFAVLRALVDAPVGRHKQLLVDDYIIAEKSNVTRVLGRVTKANDGKPIFTDGWFYGTVLHDEGRFKLWFRKPGTAGYGYAESPDGLHFETRGDVTGINFAGDYTLSVEIDPHDSDPQHRFMAAYDAPGMAAGVAHSADGITWVPYNEGQPVTTRAADTYNQILFDANAATYRLFTRTDFGPPGGSQELRGTRTMLNRNLASQPADWQPVRQWAFDREGAAEAKRRQIYALTCWPYEGIYFALMSVYEYPGDVSEGRDTDHQKRHERDVMNFYIATSRDADTWDLRWVYASQPLIPRGADGSFDKDLLLPASTIVTHDDQHWLYYAGGNERHGSPETHFDRQHAIGLAKLRLDGFMALEAREESGIIETKPFQLEGNRLQVNVDAHAGEIQVEVLDESGQPIPEYSGAHAAATQNIDELRWEPQWPTTKDLSALQGQRIRLRFHLREGRLYAFQIE